MPDISANPRQLQPALAGRDYWLFFTDDVGVHVRQAMLAFFLDLRSDTDRMLFGILDYLDSVGVIQKASFLAVPKDMMDREAVRRFLRCFGVSDPTTLDDEQDLFVATQGDVRELLRLLQGIRDGQFFSVGGE